MKMLFDLLSSAVSFVIFFSFFVFAIIACDTSGWAGLLLVGKVIFWFFVIGAIICLGQAVIVGIWVGFLCVICFCWLGICKVFSTAWRIIKL
jgi:hypothetical protein